MTKLAARVQAMEAQLAQRFGTDLRSCRDEELYARVQSGGPGFDLTLIPGKTLNEKVGAVLAAADGKLTLTPEARHAARGWFDILDAV